MSKVIVVDKYDAKVKAFKTNDRYDADLFVKIVDSQYDADVKIYFTDDRYDAGWKKSHNLQNQMG